MKQVKLNQIPNFINRLCKEGHTVTRLVKNGNTGGTYCIVEWI